jgi:hypothetical protein
MLRGRSGLLFGVLLCSVVASPVSDAALVQRDLVSVDDGLVTLDTATNLEWLDTSVLAMQDRWDVSWGWIHGIRDRVDPRYRAGAIGWQAATLSQVLDLFGRYSGVYATYQGNTPIGDLYLAQLAGAADVSGMDAITQLILGRSGRVTTQHIYFGGDLVGSADGNKLGYLRIEVGEASASRFYANYHAFYGADPVSYFSSYGAFLVREAAAVPVPATAALFGVGMIGLRLARRR